MSHRFGPRAHQGGVLAGNDVAMWMPSSQIRLIQRGIVSIGTGATSATTAITSVNTACSVVRFLGFASENQAAALTEINGYLELTNATTVTGTHQTAGQNLEIGFEVIEYWPGVIRLVQRGTIVINATTSNTATITSVDTAKSELSSLGNASNDSNAQNYTARLVFTNATTITSIRVGATGTQTTSYQVVQWW